MEKIATIEQVLDQTEHIVKYKKTILSGIVLLVLGISCLVISSKLDISSNGVLYPLLLIGGVMLTVWGAVAILKRKTRYKLEPGGAKISFSELYFDVNEKQELLRIMEQRDLEALEKLSIDASNGVQLRIAASADETFCYTQLKAFIPYEYIEINEVCKHTPEEAKIILHLKSKHK